MYLLSFSFCYRLRNGMGETECTQTQWPDHQSNRLTHDLQPPARETNPLSIATSPRSQTTCSFPEWATCNWNFLEDSSLSLSVYFTPLPVFESLPKYMWQRFTPLLQQVLTKEPLFSSWGWSLFPHLIFAYGTSGHRILNGTLHVVLKLSTKP